MSVISDGAMPVSFDFDIFSPPTSSQPWPKTRFGTGSPAAMSIAGQMTAWNRAMSLPTMCTLGQRRRNCLVVVAAVAERRDVVEQGVEPHVERRGRSSHGILMPQSKLDREIDRSRSPCLTN